MKIEYLGKTLNTSYFDGTYNYDKIQYIRDNFYTKDKEKALKQLEGILLKGKTQQHFIHRYYFEEIADKGKKYNTKWSIRELLDSDELVQVFYNKTLANTKLFTDDDIRNFRKAISLGGSSNIGKLTMFPMKECLLNIKNYLPENATTYIDPCCGWGTRMIASATMGLEYIGFDVNSELIEKLEELGRDIQTIKPDFKFKIYKQGSQYKVDDLENKADIIFTSPPYFDLELYNNNDYETNKDIMSDYDLWISDFIKPLMSNLKSYAKDDCKILINIKNYNNYTITEDIVEYAESIGLKQLETSTLKTNKRLNSNKEIVNNDEPILVFSK